MRIISILPCLLAVLLGGCVNIISQDSFLYEYSEFDRVNSAAEECVKILSEQVIGSEDKYIFTFAFYVGSQSEDLRESRYTRSISIAIPYFITSALDKNISGSAWCSCMKEKDALVQQIKFM